MALFDAVTDLPNQQESIRKRRYGVIEASDGQFRRIRFRPWPKLMSLLEIWTLGMRAHFHRHKDQCLLFFNQPLMHKNYLVIPYILSYAGTSPTTCRSALKILDQVACVKGSDAILCEVSNSRISDRAMQRWGWESHLPGNRRRHFIKRFYGEYPEHALIDRFPGLSQKLATHEATLVKATPQKKTETNSALFRSSEMNIHNG